MKHNYLFPHSYKKWGWILAVPTLTVLGIWFTLWLINDTISTLDGLADSLLNLLDKFINNGYTLEVMMTLAYAGLMMISFSKTKVEDEYVQIIRLNSLVWAMIINYALVIVATWITYDLTYLYILFASLFSLPILFVAKFSWELHKLHKTDNDEE